MKAVRIALCAGFALGATLVFVRALNPQPLPPGRNREEVRVLAQADAGLDAACTPPSDR